MEEKYKVVKIIDTQNIVINAGKEHYIKKGDKFEIYSIGEEIEDLDGNSLGTLDTIKETVTVVTVFSKMCICQKIINPSSYFSKLGQLAQSATEEVDSLNVKQEDCSGGLSNDTTIRIGDFARMAE